MFLIVMFFEQWLVIGTLLLFLQRALKLRISVRRLVVAATLGSLSGCGIVNLPPEMQMGKFFFLWISLMVTVWIFFGKTRKIVTLTGYLLGIACIYGGGWTVITTQINVNWLLGFFLTAMLAVLGYQTLWNTYRQQKDYLYQVSFCWKGNHMTFCGLEDTGNFLYEPIEHLPVSVVEENALKKQCKESYKQLEEKHEMTGIRIIPYRSVGKEAGIMTGLIVTDLVITNGKQTTKVDRSVVAISKERLSTKGHYEILLHSDLINHGRL